MLALTCLLFYLWEAITFVRHYFMFPICILKEYPVCCLPKESFKHLFPPGRAQTGEGYQEKDLKFLATYNPNIDTCDCLQKSGIVFHKVINKHTKKWTKHIISTLFNSTNKHDFNCYQFLMGSATIKESIRFRAELSVIWVCYETVQSINITLQTIIQNIKGDLKITPHGTINYLIL